MHYLIGTDEAGYGPNLGPLVVSATVWRVPDGVGGDGLYDLLGEGIVSTPRAATNGSRVAMADSKALYQPKRGLRLLERGLLTALELLDRQPRSWTETFDALAPESADARSALPWYADYQSAVPLDADPAELAPLGPSVGDALEAAGVRLVELRSRVVFPPEFNRLVERSGSKGTTLSHLTLGLLAELIGPLDGEPVSVVCDKHGGRNRYHDLLSEHFPDRFIEIHGEGRQRSVYRFGSRPARVEVRFQSKAESHLPAALASMASKYLRELAMRAFNSFWRERIPELRPTAGYPQDARRFREEIAAMQVELGIDDGVLWRNK